MWTNAGNRGADISRAVYWWQASGLVNVHAYDYPHRRVKDAKSRSKREGSRFEETIRAIAAASHSTEGAVRGITQYVQSAVIHNPIFQPATSDWLYRLARRLGRDPDEFRNCAYAHPLARRLLSQLEHTRWKPEWPSLITDPDLLIALGEARCGQVVNMLCKAFSLISLKSRPLPLGRHIACEVSFDGGDHIIDADAFKNGIFIEVNGQLATTGEVLDNPHLVDRFKHTGWMFRRDSIYALNRRKRRPYEGYVDLYSPEIDGQISVRYGAASPLLPPGVPEWKPLTASTTLTVGKSIALEFECRFVDRAAGFKVRCGRRSKRYCYDALIPANLANETSKILWEIDTRDHGVELRFKAPGVYYVTAAAIPHYVESHPSYIWWSDELELKVTPR